MLSERKPRKRRARRQPKAPWGKRPGWYAEYLKSAHWNDVKRRYRASALRQTCAVCGETNVDLHHKTYKRIGCERLQDLVPLCRDHHQSLHVENRDSDGKHIWKTSATFIRRERKRRQRDGQPARATERNPAARAERERRAREMNGGVDW